MHVTNLHEDLTDWYRVTRLPEGAKNLRRAYWGQTMVERETFIPCGYATVFFEPDGTRTINCHFGPWLRTYPKDILREMKRFTDELRGNGLTEFYAVEDARIDGADTLIRWFNGENTGKKSNMGFPIYKIDLRKARI